MSKKQGMITHRGQVNKADHDGVTVERSEYLYVDFNAAEETGRRDPAMVPSAPYEEHFIYEVPSSRRKIGQSDFMCTCGSAAVVKDWAIPGNRLFVCLLHAETGFHQTSLINADERQGGLDSGPIKVRGRNWLI